MKRRVRISGQTAFILVALLVSISLLALSIFQREQGEEIWVEVNGEATDRIPLYLDCEYSLCGGSNILVVKNGEAYLSYADCPDQVCVRTGRIRYAGQSIVCLPNRLVIKIVAKGGSDMIL